MLLDSRAREASKSGSVREKKVKCRNCSVVFKSRHAKSLEGGFTHLSTLKTHPSFEESLHGLVIPRRSSFG